MRDVAAEFRHLLHQRGAGVAELLVRHHEMVSIAGCRCRFISAMLNSNSQIRKVRAGADDRVGLLLAGKVHEQAAKTW